MNYSNNSKDLLIDTAVELFKKKGFDQVSIIEICKKANVTRNAFYYYFKSKDEIILDYFKNRITSKEDLFSNIIKLNNDWDRYLELYNIHLQIFIDEGIQFTKQLIKINLEDENNVLNDYLLTGTWCIPILINCQKNGLVRQDIDAKELNFLATRLGIGLLSSWCGSNGDFDLKQELKKGFELLLKR